MSSIANEFNLSKGLDPFFINKIGISSCLTGEYNKNNKTSHPVGEVHMQTRNIDNKYLNNFITVLNRYKIPFELEEKEAETYSLVSTDLSSEDYERYVERAMCEYESETMHSGRFVISYNELMNHKDELQKEFFPNRNGMAYHILSKDRDKVEGML